MAKKLHNVKKVILLNKFDLATTDITELANMLAERCFYVGETCYRDRSTLMSEIQQHNIFPGRYAMLFHDGEVAIVSFHDGEPEKLTCDVRILDVHKVDLEEIDWLLNWIINFYRKLSVCIYTDDE